MIWPILRTGIYAALGAAELAADAYGAGKRIWRRLKPARGRSSPLTHLDVERQAKAARCAGHESEPQCKAPR